VGRVYARSAMNTHYGTHLTPTNIRRVWAAITRNPNASNRELARTVGLSFGAIAGALRFLKDASYITFPKGRRRAITVLIPFLVEELQ
jgi:predicted transcriptional regulator